VLGYLGATLEWDETDRCTDDAGVGQEYDLENSTSCGGAESPGVPKGYLPGQSRDASSGSPLEAGCDIAQVRHFDQPGVNCPIR